MARAIYKYQISPLDDAIEAAYLLRVIHVAPDYSEQYKQTSGWSLAQISEGSRIQEERMTFWAEVGIGSPIRTIPINVIGTGVPIPQNNIHCGTAVMPSGLVWHLYIPVGSVPFQASPAHSGILAR